MVCHSCNIGVVKIKELCSKCYKKSYYSANRLKEKESRLTWRKVNVEKVNQYEKKYWKHKYHSDINFRISKNIRKRLNKLLKIKSIKKVDSVTKSLGCTQLELKLHLQSKFQSGMSWSNYGQWHIDHVKPLASFDLSSVDDFASACHYTNLQPLWAADNYLKSDKE